MQYAIKKSYFFKSRQKNYQRGAINRSRNNNGMGVTTQTQNVHIGNGPRAHAEYSPRVDINTGSASIKSRNTTVAPYNSVYEYPTQDIHQVTAGVVFAK